MYILAPETLFLEITIYFFRAAQIISSKSMQVINLKQNKTLTKILTNNFNFIGIFLKEKILVLLKQINLNEYAIKLKNDQ